MRGNLLGWSLVLITIGCGRAQQPSEGAKDGVNDSTVTNSQPIMQQCYQNQPGADTVRLSLTDSAGLVSGKLDYHIQGKDANTGSFTGRMYGDTLIADYNFNSEGVLSTREIAFLKKDSFLVEGFGPVLQEQQGMKFKSMDSLSFNEVNRLMLVNCQ